MTEKELVQLCKLGESTTVQYKLEFTTQKQIVEELVAFANTRGGIIIFGAEDKTGRMVGLTYEQVQYTSRELGNAANEQVRPIIYIETEIVMHEEMAYLIAYVKNGEYKPYKDLAGNIWVKQSSDKRRVTENSEIRRLMQNSRQYQADEDGVDGTSEDDIDTKALDEYFKSVFGKRADEFNMPVAAVMKNAHITDALGRLTIAGLIDRPDGNQFIARIWRTTPKDELATQKANEELISTTQKEEEAVRKTKNTTQKPLTATQKAILDYLKANPTATRLEVAEALGNISEDGVKYNIGRLQQYGCLKREKGRKNGCWVVISRV